MRQVKCLNSSRAGTLADLRSCTESGRDSVGSVFLGEYEHISDIVRARVASAVRQSVPELKGRVVNACDSD
jgi:hypothetical protein